MNEVLLRRKVAWALDVAERVKECASEETRFILWRAIQLGRWRLAGLEMPCTTREVMTWLTQIQDGAYAGD